MTNILQYPTTTSSITNNITIPSLNDQSLTSNSKSATIVIQRPGSSLSFANSLLIKRRNPAELGDMLMKKIKSKTGSYEDNSSQNNSNYDGNSSESPNSSRLNENIESNSMNEDMASPSIRSLPEELEIPPVKKLFPVQKSLIVPNRQAIKASRNESADNQKQIQQALEMLQKKMLIDQVASLREAFLKEHIAQEPLYIPPLMSFNDAPRVQEGSFNFNDNEDQPKVFIGPVEYPLLSQANAETAQKGSVLNIPSSLLLLSNAKISTNSHRSLLDSLCVTRAETQRSGSDGSPSQVNEEFLQAADGRKKRAKKVKEEVAEKVKKTQKKERKPVKGRGKAKNDSYLSESSQSP